MVAQIGSLITVTTGAETADRGWGKLSGSLDEFRYWKKKRSDKDIQKYWFTQVHGGTNKFEANSSLGVYYKFNEGIYHTGTVNRFDSTVLDYSGRISNGTWVGYSVGSRETGSAIIEASASAAEYRDPIIYSTHPFVQSLQERLLSTGSQYDTTNNSAILNHYPEWIIDEDETVGDGSLKNLSQIMGEFFDDLMLKIKALPTIRDVAYKSEHPNIFARNLLENFGFQTTDLFSDLSVLENFLSRNEEKDFEEKIETIKNTIYQNLYNNLVYIYRSKGTEKSLRNYLRCFGIDDEVIKINIYSDQQEYLLEDKFQYSTVKKKYIDFNHTDRFDATVYQMTGADQNPNTKSYITGNADFRFLGSTFECEAIFPRKLKRGHELFFPTDFVSCSLFGMHEAKINQLDFGWPTTDKASIQVFAVRPEEESKNVKFLLTSSYFGVLLTSSLFEDVYDDQKWNFAVRIKHDKYPYAGLTSGSIDGNYKFELYGVNAVQDILQQKFILSASVTASLAEEYFKSAKRIYVGAHRTNFTGAANTGPGVNNEQFCDAKISSVRFWYNILPDDVIDLHAIDVLNYGPEGPYQNVKPFYATPLQSGNYIPQIDTLALHWDFALVSGSDNGNGEDPQNSSDAKFYVEDISSGSVVDATSGSFLDLATKFRHPGRGDFFLRKNTDMASTEFVYSGRRRLPWNVHSDDLIKILNFDDEQQTRDTRPVNYYFSLEKNPYQNVSEEMLNWFGTMKDFNSLIGKPKYKYEDSYRELNTLKRMFFRRVENTPDFERFVDFYKWIDSSIMKMMKQLLPASVNINERIGNVVESHLFERNKFRHKLPILFDPLKPPEASIKTVGERKYQWKYGHRPLSVLERDNCFWWNIKAERSGSLNTSRVGIQQVIKAEFDRSFNQITHLNVKIDSFAGKKVSDPKMLLATASLGKPDTQFIALTASLLLEQEKDCSDFDGINWKRVK